MRSEGRPGEAGRILPDAIIGGAQKSGTTTLFHLLASHPGIFFPREPQEPHFFDLDENYRRGLDWYASLFRGWAGQAVVAEKSPLYLYDERVPERIAEALGREVRFLFVLRHPADRAWSHYWHEVRHGFESLDFAAALDGEPARLARSYWHRRHFSYVDRGRYASQLERYFARFPRANVLVLLYEELRRDPQGVARRCAEFLGVASGGWEVPVELGPRRRNEARLPRSRALQRLVRPLRRPGLDVVARAVDRLNLVSAPYPPLAPELRRRITDAVGDEIERLGPIAGIDVRHWLAHDPRSREGD